MMKLLISIACVFLTLFTDAQILSSKGATIHINSGAVLYCNGGIVLSNATQLTNNGEFTTTKNSTLIQPGDFKIDNTTTVSGDGKYNIEQDWINNAVFTGGNSEVVLFGDVEQLITSSNGTITEFNNLTLTGNGTGVNRRKSLVNVDASTGIQGILQLNDRELNTESNIFTVQNEVP